MKIHPTYIQEMISIKLNDSEMIDGINQLKDYGALRYDANLVRSEFQKPIKLQILIINMRHKKCSLDKGMKENRCESRVMSF